MLLSIPDVLTAEQVSHARQVLDQAEWVDGRVTAGHQSAKAKDNQQLPEDSAVARELGQMILAALQRNPMFLSAALPLQVFPPLFNRYQGGSRSAPTWTIRSARSPALRTASARISRPRFSSPTLTSTTAASWWWRTPTAFTASSCRLAIW